MLVRRAGGGYDNHAGRFGVDASGWSWAAQFGDLDNDGFLDLYVVNGMMSEELFAHVSAYALVEENQVFPQRRQRRIPADAAVAVGLERRRRGMVMVDLDDDGDLGHCGQQSAGAGAVAREPGCVTVAPHFWFPCAGRAGINTGAIGSRLVLHTSAGELHREITASSGYLSGNVAAVHFGFPRTSEPLRLQIDWPDGAISFLDQPAPDTRITVIRG